MKQGQKIGIILITVAFLGSFLIANYALAHPGRTDKRGGHTCKTNCKKWGLKYGQYHFHRLK